VIESCRRCPPSPSRRARSTVSSDPRAALARRVRAPDGAAGRRAVAKVVGEQPKRRPRNRQLSLEQPGLFACYQAAASGAPVSAEHAGQPLLRLLSGGWPIDSAMDPLRDPLGSLAAARTRGSALIAKLCIQSMYIVCTYPRFTLQIEALCLYFVCLSKRDLQTPRLEPPRNTSAPVGPDDDPAAENSRRLRGHLRWTPARFVATVRGMRAFFEAITPSSAMTGSPAFET
jgi:hypothetical protein